MKSHEIRQSFTDFFAQRGHRPVKSAPLVPHGDPTLLFVNAGMVPFKGYFTGDEEPPTRRAVSVQKCLRVSGKHNDLENVGPSARHHTFFEMLGNFSFGDYFKAEAIDFAWELVTGVWGLDPSTLFATVFRDDDEAHALWRKVSGLPEDRVLRCGEKDNFWAMGDTGPCGPCSEIFVDTDPGAPRVGWEEGGDSGRYLEIWNLVFMQFDRAADGSMKPLPKPSVDTGAGLERVSAVLQGVASNYDTDLFVPVLAAAAELAGTRYGAGAESDVSLRVIADHLRAVGFLLADGVIPGNEGRGYVLRRILRRAVRHGMRLGFEEPFLHRLLPVLGEVMDAAYPELAATRAASQATVRTEEEKFLSTVATGARQVQEEIEAVRAAGRNELTGDVLFLLYDTYGVPLDVIREIAEEEQVQLDEERFEAALEERREQSRAGTEGGQQRLPALRAVLQGGSALPPTVFKGYRELELQDAQVQRLILLGGEADATHTREIKEGQQGVAILQATVFYAQGGGEVGDTGEFTWPGGRARVTDCQKDLDVVLHFVEVLEGTLSEFDEFPCGSTPSAAAPSSATTPPPTCCTRRCARSSARGCARPARWWRRTACASTSPIRTRWTRRRWRASRRRSTPGCWRRRPPRSTCAATRRPSPPAPWRCSARSTATRCVPSPSPACRSSCAAAATSPTPARSASSWSPRSAASPPACAASRRSPARAPTAGCARSASCSNAWRRRPACRWSAPPARWRRCAASSRTPRRSCRGCASSSLPVVRAVPGARRRRGRRRRGGGRRHQGAHPRGAGGAEQRAAQHGGRAARQARVRRGGDRHPRRGGGQGDPARRGDRRPGGPGEGGCAGQGAGTAGRRRRRRPARFAQAGGREPGKLPAAFAAVAAAVRAQLAG